MGNVPLTNPERVVWQAAFELRSAGRTTNTTDAAAFADEVLDFLREIENDVWDEVGKIDRGGREEAE